MFTHNNSSNNDNKNSANDAHTNTMLGMLVLGILGLAVHQSMPSISAFYIRNFQTVWMTAWVLVLGLVFLAVRWFVKKNRDLEIEALTHEHVVAPVDPACIYVGEVGTTNVFLTRKQRLGHVQILGTTGRGKTESLILPWIVRDARNGFSSLVIDGKGDPELVQQLKSALRGRANIQVFDLGTPKRSAVMNPLSFGGPQEVTDRIFASFDFLDPFYKGVQYDTALSLISAIKASGETLTFSRLHACLASDQELARVAKACSNMRQKERLQKMLASPRPTREANHMGLSSQLAPYAEGELAGLLNGRRTKDDELLELEATLIGHRKPGQMPTVLIVLLPTLKYQIMAKQLGRMLLQELAGCIGSRASRGGASSSFYPVYLDEFSAFAYQGFEQILNKARSSQVALHLSHQSMSDLSMVSPDFARTVNTNTNVKCLLGLNDPDTADFYARHIGTKGSERRTERIEDMGFMNRSARTGQASVREVEEYKIHPNELKNFNRGHGVLHLPTPDGNFTARVQFARLAGKEKHGE